MSDAEQPDIIFRVFHALNAYLVGGPGCPRPGALGECALAGEENGRYFAIVMWWRPGRICISKLAKIVRDQGGDNIWINHELYSDANCVRNGRNEDRMRALEITFNGTGDEVAAWPSTKQI
jgi:hypothetical protein